MPPIGRVIPRMSVNGAASAQLSRDLTSLRVRAVEGRASVQVVLLCPLDKIADLNTDEVESNRLDIHLHEDEEFFSGTLTALVTRLPLDGQQRTVLRARGVVPEDAAGASIALRFGQNISSGSVRREGGRCILRARCNVLELRPNSRIDVLTGDPAFDGPFRVTQLRYRLDAGTGMTVEFNAEAERA